MNLSKPLGVDLDGTLIRSDLLHESALALLKSNPLYLLLMPFWLLRGKANLKHQIASRVDIDGALLPYNMALVTWLRGQAEAGRELWLCTASDRSLAQRVADHLGFFKGVLASDGSTNLAGSAKARTLVERFGEKGFEYCGNHAVDLAIWRHAAAAIVVNARSSVEEAARKVTTVAAVFPSETKPGWRTVFKALRIHQWAKNVLVFAPLLAAHLMFDPVRLSHTVLAFIAFGLCASSVYLVNDLVDLAADRQHPRKANRPFASGALPATFGFVAAPLLLLVSILITLTLPHRFAIAMFSYLVITTAYSFWVKRVLIADVIALAALYTLRLLAGAATAEVPLSFWMLLFSMFLFLSLALVKRSAELLMIQDGGGEKASGRGYQVDDLTLLQSLGGSAGYMSVLVLALYINSPEITALYMAPKMIWLLCPLLLHWISRIWVKTHRGEMHDDPVVFALKDRLSLFTFALCGAVLLFAAWPTTARYFVVAP